MSSHLPGPRQSRVVAATLLGILATGCNRPLALQHEYFRPTSGPAARTSVQVQHAVSLQLALQAAQRACATPVPAAPPPGPDLGSPAAREALAEVCARHRSPNGCRVGARRHVQCAPALGGGSGSRATGAVRDRLLRRRRLNPITGARPLPAR